MLPFRRVAALLALAASSAGAQLTIRVRTLPPATPPDATPYVAGSFDAWRPGDPRLALRRGESGWTVTLPDGVRGPIEFKLTLGAWESVETTADGGDVPNRRHTIPAAGADTLDVTVAAWRAAGRAAKRSTARPTVRVVSDSFGMPQLGRARRVWVYVPPDYASSSRRYPVLYLHDGQNVFDAATSFAGEWGVDETLDSLRARGDPGAIVVAVDNGGAHRLDEYDPWRSPDPRLGGGEGAAYVEFLARTLKPWVDRRYRTLPDPAHTGIMGSSMGGLISLYAALQHPDVFGRAVVLSCACWVAEPSVYAFAARAARGIPARARPRLYLAIGAGEGSDGRPARDQRRVADSLRAAGFGAAALLDTVLADGAHQEWFWRREFPAAYQWLFGEKR